MNVTLIAALDDRSGDGRAVPGSGSAAGALVQWDTSTHEWLEGRGEPIRYLVRLIDDATSRNWGRFVWRDGTRENMGVLWEYVERYGRMVDTYTGRPSWPFH